MATWLFDAYKGTKMKAEKRDWLNKIAALEHSVRRNLRWGMAINWICRACVILFLLVLVAFSVWLWSDSFSWHHVLYLGYAHAVLIIALCADRFFAEKMVLKAFYQEAEARKLKVSGWNSHS